MKWVLGITLILGGVVAFFLMAFASGMASRSLTRWESIGPFVIGGSLVVVGIIVIGLL